MGKSSRRVEEKKSWGEIVFLLLSNTNVHEVHKTFQNKSSTFFVNFFDERFPTDELCRSENIIEDFSRNFHHWSWRTNFFSSKIFRIILIKNFRVGEVCEWKYFWTLSTENYKFFTNFHERKTLNLELSETFCETPNLSLIQPNNSKLCEKNFWKNYSYHSQTFVRRTNKFCGNFKLFQTFIRRQNVWSVSNKFTIPFLFFNRHERNFLSAQSLFRRTKLRLNRIHKKLKIVFCQLELSPAETNFVDSNIFWGNHRRRKLFRGRVKSSWKVSKAKNFEWINLPLIFSKVSNCPQDVERKVELGRIY